MKIGDVSFLYKFGFKGFSFYSPVDLTQAECLNFKKYEYKVALLLLKKDKQNQAYSQIVSKCRKEFSKNFEDMIDFPESFQSSKDLSKFLKSNHVQNKKLIQTIYRLKKDKKDLFENFAKAVKLEIPKSNEQKFWSLKNHYEDNKNISSVFWTTLIDMAISLESGNKFWTTALVEKFVNLSPMSAIYEGDFVGKGWDEKYLLEIFTILIEKLKPVLDNELFKLFVSQVRYFSNSNDYQSLVNKYEADWSLQNLRDKISDPIYMNQFFPVWNRLISPRVSSIELGSAWSKVVKQDFVSNTSNKENFWVYSLRLPNSDDERKYLVNIGKSLVKSSILGDHFILLEALENHAFKKMMSEEISTFKKPIFSLKRSTLRNNLEKGNMTDYILFQLWAIGDLVEDDLWWITL